MTKKPPRSNAKGAAGPTGATGPHRIAVQSAPASGAVLYGSPITPGPSGPGAVGVQIIQQKPTFALVDLLNRVIRGYLFGDLDALRDEVTPKPVGAAGYPMVMAVMAGSELLGRVSSDSKDHIPYYWSEFMAKINPAYTYLGKIAEQLCRNGVAHSYLSHLGVGVVRGEPSRHLGREQDGLIFDCLQLYADFRTSYESHAEPHLLHNHVAAQRRLDDLVAHDIKKSQPLLAALPPSLFPRRGPSSVKS